MVRNRNPFPNERDLVVAKVVSISYQYITVELEDYVGNDPEKSNAIGMVLISELSNARIRNIRYLVTEGQRLVLLVIKVDEEKGQVDLSLRQVSKENQSNILASWKQEQKAEQQLLYINENFLNMDAPEFYDKVVYPLIDYHEDLRNAFEAIKEFGIESIENLEIPEADKLKIVDFISAHTQLSFVEIAVEFDIRIPESNGIEIIKAAFDDFDKYNVPNNIEVEFSYLGAPNYRCVVKARDYVSAEKTLTKIQEQLKSKISESKKGSFDMIRVES